MKIEDVKIGTKVKLISTENTDEHLGYDLDQMLHVGSVSEVVDFGDEGDECHNVGLSDGYCYAVGDLELYEDTGKVLSEIKVKLSLEDKKEVAKDILKIALQDLNVIITDAIDSLSNDSLSSDNTSEAIEEVKQPVDVPTVASNVDFSEEKLQSMFEEVMKDVMKEYLRDSINTLNKTAFGI